jgi:hypothetical protein
MELPRINRDRLQQVVNMIEKSQSFRDLEALTYAVAQHNWAEEMKLDAKTIGQLIEYHDIQTKTLRFGQEPSKLVKPLKVEAPAPKPEPKSKAKPTPKYLLKSVAKPPKAGVTSKKEELPKPAAPPIKVESPKKEEPLKPVTSPKVEVRLPKPELAKVEEPPITESNIQTYDEGGRGRKQCPKCKKYIGARNVICACGYEFKGKGQDKVAEVCEESVQTKAARIHLSAIDCKSVVWVPAGKPPVQLNGTDESDLVNWTYDIRRAYADKNNAYLSLNALKYWLRNGYNLSEQEIKVAQANLVQVLSHEVNQE